MRDDFLLAALWYLGWGLLVFLLAIVIFVVCDVWNTAKRFLGRK